MTQQPFDPMDKLLREALASDALPPSDLTDRIMAQVERTPQGGSAASDSKRNYKKWLLTAAACLVIVGAAFPLALQGRARPGPITLQMTPPPPIRMPTTTWSAATTVETAAMCQMAPRRLTAPADTPSRHKRTTPHTTNPLTRWTALWTMRPRCWSSRAVRWRSWPCG